MMAHLALAWLCGGEQGAGHYVAYPSQPDATHFRLMITKLWTRPAALSKPLSRQASRGDSASDFELACASSKSKVLYTSCPSTASDENLDEASTSEPTGPDFVMKDFLQPAGEALMLVCILGIMFVGFGSCLMRTWDGPL